MKDKVLAVDPGKMTGYSTIDLRFTPEEFMSAELPHMDFLDWAHWKITHNEFRAVVCESYIITASTLQKSRGENWSLEQIGVLRFLCHQAGIPFTLQSPSEAKSFATDVKLKRAGWYNIGHGHANDAARHMLTYAARKKLIDLRRLKEGEA